MANVRAGFFRVLVSVTVPANGATIAIEVLECYTSVTGANNSINIVEADYGTPVGVTVGA